MLEQDEMMHWSDKLGVSTDQIRHDHLVSHVLAALASINFEEPPAFYGGTALSRTLLDELRVSEDIDLLHPQPPQLFATLAENIPQALRREFPGLRVEEPVQFNDTWTSYIVTEDLRLKIQITRPQALDPWEFATTAVSLRYSDLPVTIEMRVPSAESFVAMKGLAWHDRRAARDLVDLGALARGGHFTPQAADLIHAKSSHRWITAEFERLPKSVIQEWDAQLAHQMRDVPNPEELAKEILAAISASTE